MPECLVAHEGLQTAGRLIAEMKGGVDEDIEP